MNDEDYPEAWKPAHVRKHEAAEQQQAEAQQAAGAVGLAAPDDTSYPTNWLNKKGLEA
jgi:hypothetical protein